MQNCPIFTELKLEKDSVTELEQPYQRTELKLENQPQKRARASEIARKLETVNGEIQAKTIHLVPPERT
ncbi:hypothetical protein AW040_00195 [Vibrio parahaemolyticus]|nr:hypothetical protein [Vibrio parahaemolyticus]KIT49255.1 hypothetical protein H331_15225 [Vibrio parahaemolyticus 3644]KIT55626.1 hypothetical protein H336_22580 [Vibrio parahaemolyticus EN9701072]EGQ9455302.1 hypothetical protein [Vibrio parahaemolyticus]EGQ9547082.1 hypothetical protein [Vibrio parahaemolyticus]